MMGGRNARLASLGTHRESLVDMDADPGELVNLARAASHRQALVEHRGYLAEWCRQTRDPFAVPA